MEGGRQRQTEIHGNRQKEIQRQRNGQEDRGHTQRLRQTERAPERAREKIKGRRKRTKRIECIGEERNLAFKKI